MDPIVADVMLSAVKMVPGRTTVADAAGLLADAHVSGAVVAEGDHVVGVVTMNDLNGWMTATDPEELGPVARSRWNGRGSLHDLRLSDLLGRRPVVARSDWTLSRALEALDAAGVQRLPVVDPRGRLVGVVSRDLLQAALRARPGAPEPG